MSDTTTRGQVPGKPDRADPKRPALTRAGDDRPVRLTAAARAKAVADAAEERDEPVSTYQTSRGTVTLGRVRHVPATDTEPACVEVWTVGDTEAGDPHWRLINPPRYVPDPDGDIVLGGRRWREDALAAVAEAIARFGGANTTRRTRG